MLSDVLCKSEVNVSLRIESSPYNHKFNDILAGLKGAGVIFTGTRNGREEMDT